MRKLAARFVSFLLVASSLALVTQHTTAAPPTGGRGPGGFESTTSASNLVRWLKADSINQTDNTAVATWADSSFNTALSSTATGTAQPVFRAGIGGLPNNQPVVRFDGVNDVVAAPTAVGGTADKTMVVVLRAGNGGGLTGRVDEFYGWYVRRDNQQFGLSNFVNNANQAVGVTASMGTGYAIASGTIEGGTNGTLTNRTSTGGFATASLAGSTSVVGFRFLGYSKQAGGIGGSGSDFFAGDVAEFLVYEKALNGVERTLVDNHLAAKYAIGVANNQYDGDDAAQGDYDLGVFGVGNDGTASHTSGGMDGFGIEATGGSLNSGEFVLAGHKQTINSPVTLEPSIAGQQGQRWNRVWYMDTNNAIVQADLAFDFNDAGLDSPAPSDSFSLLYSADQNFNWQSIAAPSLISGDTVSFAGMNLSSGYYTLGLNVMTVPEPSTFILLGLGMAGIAWPVRRKRG